MAETLAGAGAHVVATDIDGAAVAETAAAAREAGGSAEARALDVTDKAAILDIAASLGAVDVLANVAGWDRIMPFTENTPEFIERIVELNYFGAVRMCHALLPAMIEAGGAKIVSVSSDAGRVGSMGETVYAGAKGGVIAFSKSLARETARHNINVNVVCPGPTDTPLFRGQPEADAAGADPRHPLPPGRHPAGPRQRRAVLRRPAQRLCDRPGAERLRRPHHGGLTRAVLRLRLQDERRREPLVHTARMVGVCGIDIFDEAERNRDRPLPAEQNRRHRVADLARMGVVRLQPFEALNERDIGLADQHGRAGALSLPATVGEPAQLRAVGDHAGVEGGLDERRAGLEPGDGDAGGRGEQRRAGAEAEPAPGLDGPGQRDLAGARPVEADGAHAAGPCGGMLVGPAGFEPATTPL